MLAFSFALVEFGVFCCHDLLPSSIHLALKAADFGLKPSQTMSNERKVTKTSLTSSVNRVPMVARRKMGSATQSLLHQADLSTVTVKCPVCQQQRPGLSQYRTITQDEQPATGEKLVILNNFHHGEDSTLSLLPQVLILGIDLLSLYVMILPKPPSVVLQNALSIIMEFHTDSL